MLTYGELQSAAEAMIKKVAMDALRSYSEMYDLSDMPDMALDILAGGVVRRLMGELPSAIGKMAFECFDREGNDPEIQKFKDMNG